MKKIFTSVLCAIVFCTISFGQTLTSFSCSSTNPTYVIGFKNGTNCTPAPFNVYTTSLNGTLSPTPLFSTPDTIELNGIGINSVDNKGYSLLFKRVAISGGCTSDTVKFIRFGANGATQMLGYIPQPAGTIVNTALGTLSATGDYYFGALINGQFSVGMISNTGGLPSGTGPLSVTYRTVTVSCNNRNFSDWAFNPATPNVLYTYGLGVNTSSQPSGIVMSLDLSVPGTPVLACVASTEQTGTFFDPADDNFGGIMFGTDGMMYGVNVNTRRYYRINPTTGIVTLISTIPADGSGTPTTNQLRGDMGSCAAYTIPVITPTPFTNCPNTYVTAFKNGTNCTVAPYNAYTVDLAGNLSASPLFTTPDTIEVNGLGMSKLDNKGYGLLFRRDNNTTPGSCINDTIKFFRFGANGVTEILGYLIRPNTTPALDLNTAVGTMDANGNYYFVTNAGIQLYLAKIERTDTLTSIPNRSIPFTTKPININCGGRIFSDWAINPYTNQLYSYCIYTNTNSQVAGGLIILDMFSGNLYCTGNENTTEFTNAGQDNMGGVMFGADGQMYAENVYTRKFYKIDPTNGNITYIKTLDKGTGPIRTDMASCVVDLTTLPLGFGSLTVASGGECKANLTWDVSGTEDGDVFTLEKSADGIKYVAVGSVRGTTGVNQYAIADTKPGITNYYRIKGLSRDGNVKYSSVARYLSSCGSKNNALLFNTMVTNGTVTGEVALYRTQNVSYTIYNAAGVQVFNKAAVNNAGISRFNFNVPALSKGVYMMQILISGEKFMQKFVVQ